MCYCSILSFLPLSFHSVHPSLLSSLVTIPSSLLLIPPTTTHYYLHPPLTLPPSPLLPHSSLHPSTHHYLFIPSRPPSHTSIPSHFILINTLPLPLPFLLIFANVYHYVKHYRLCGSNEIRGLSTCRWRFMRVRCPGVEGK